VVEEPYHRLKSSAGLNSSPTPFVHSSRPSSCSALALARKPDDEPLRRGLRIAFPISCAISQVPIPGALIEARERRERSLARLPILGIVRC
jgi:hypothetical protein